MSKFELLAAPSLKERRHRRYDLRLEGQLSFASRSCVHHLETTSRNVSVRGLLLEAGYPVERHTRVQVTMTVRGPASRRPVRLLGRGEVVRLQPLESGAGFAIAVECLRPISQRKNSLPGAS